MKHNQLMQKNFGLETADAEELSVMKLPSFPAQCTGQISITKLL